MKIIFIKANLRTLAVNKDEQNMVLLCQRNIDVALTDKLVADYLIKHKYSECAQRLRWLTPVLTKTPHYLIISKQVKKRNADIRIFLTDNTKIKNILDWEPKLDTRKIIKDTFNWIMKNKSELEGMLL